MAQFLSLLALFMASGVGVHVGTHNYRTEAIRIPLAGYFSSWIVYFVLNDGHIAPQPASQGQE